MFIIKINGADKTYIANADEAEWTATKNRDEAYLFSSRKDAVDYKENNSVQGSIVPA